MKVHIETINETHIRINSEISVIKELAQKYCFRADKYMFHPKFKAGVWDGYIRLINQRNGFAPKGLVPSILQHLVADDYEISLDEDFKWFKTKYDFDYKKYQLPFEPYDYQIAAVQRALDKKRQIILSPTGSGKSVIQYLMIREILDVTVGKIVLIVPDIGLVEQMYNDFIEYSVNNGWDVEANCHKIYDYKGATKETDKRVIISTYQSLYKDPISVDDIKGKHKKGFFLFDEVEAIIGDECFHEDSLVLTECGYVKISDIKVGDCVINYDEKEKLFKKDYVINIHKNIQKSIFDEMLEIELINGEIIKVTGNHKFLTKNRGWIEARCLTEFDDIISYGEIK